MKLFKLVLFLFVFSPFIVYAEQIYYGDYNPQLISDHIDVPVVAISNDYTISVLGQVRLGLIENGNNRIIFDQRTQVDSSTIISVVNAIRYSKRFSNNNYDFFIAYDLNSNTVSGQSTGSSIALGFSALFLNKSIQTDFVVTGPIDQNGYLHSTGGLPVKVAVLETKKISNLLIPSENAKDIALIEKIIYNNRIIIKDLDIIKFSKVKHNVTAIPVNHMQQIIDTVLI